MLLSILIYSFVACFAAVGGIYLMRFFDGAIKKISFFLLSFAAGLLLANAFLHLLPEAINLTSNWPIFVLVAMAALYFLEHLFVVHSCQEEGCSEHNHIGWMSLFGLSFHSLIDGVAIGISFEADFGVGIATSLAIIFHKLVEGGCTYGLLLCGEFSKNKALAYSWLVALATPFGAIMVYFLARQASQSIMGALLAAAAGVFIYIGASDLVPASHKRRSILNVILFLAGIALVWLM